MKNFVLGASSALTAFLVAHAAGATTYQVGPSRTLKSLNDVLPMTAPGDIVEVDGDATYMGDTMFKVAGTKAAPITIRGVRKNGKRPVLSSGDFLVNFRTDHFVFEGFEVTAGASACIFIAGDDVTIRDTFVHDCPANGIVGSDDSSGTQIFEYVEVARCGMGEYNHQLYIATDEVAHPGSVFRMEHCYVHDGNGGNNVKSRAERTEIYSNWIEGALYHELDLIGPDTGHEDLVREDADVVGNVLVKKADWDIARLGGDGSGRTNGRYRFVNNTMILAADSKWAFYLQDGIDSVEFHNNVFYQKGAATISLVKDGDAVWASGSRVVGGSNNWIQTGFLDVPPEFTGNVTGADPGFLDLASFDVRLAMKSALVDAGDDHPTSPAGHDFPNPLLLPASFPPLRRAQAPGDDTPRKASGAEDIGAFELGEGTGGAGPGTGGGPGSGAGQTSSGTAAGAGGGADGDTSSDDGGCGCEAAGAGEGSVPVALLAAMAAIAVGRRRRSGPLER